MNEVALDTSICQMYECKCKKVYSERLLIILCIIQATNLKNTSLQLGLLSLLISLRYIYIYVTFNLCFSSIDIKETHLGDLLLGYWGINVAVAY